MNNCSIPLQEEKQASFDLTEVTFYADLTEVRSPHKYIPSTRGQRGEVRKYNYNTRRRFQQTLAKLHKTSLYFYFLTLTFPSLHSSNCRTWKNNLKAFFDWLEKEYGCAIGCFFRWVILERGPHIHVLLVTNKRLCTCAGGVKRHKPGNHGTRIVYLHKRGCGMKPYRESVSNQWATIVKKGFKKYLKHDLKYDAECIKSTMEIYGAEYIKHIQYGTNVEEVKNQDLEHIIKYITRVDKEEVEIPEGFGTLWGKVEFDKKNRGGFDFSPQRTVYLTPDQAENFKGSIQQELRATNERGKKYASLLDMRKSYSVMGFSERIDQILEDVSPTEKNTKNSDYVMLKNPLPTQTISPESVHTDCPAQNKILQFMTYLHHVVQPNNIVFNFLIKIISFLVLYSMFRQ